MVELGRVQRAVRCWPGDAVAVMRGVLGRLRGRQQRQQAVPRQRAIDLDGVEQLGRVLNPVRPGHKEPHAGLHGRLRGRLSPRGEGGGRQPVPGGGATRMGAVGRVGRVRGLWHGPAEARAPLRGHVRGHLCRECERAGRRGVPGRRAGGVVGVGPLFQLLGGVWRGPTDAPSDVRRFVGGRGEGGKWLCGNGRKQYRAHIPGSFIGQRCFQASVTVAAPRLGAQSRRTRHARQRRPPWQVHGASGVSAQA